MVQLSHPYMTTGKIIALTKWTFVIKVMPLLFNMLPNARKACAPEVQGKQKDSPRFFFLRLERNFKSFYYSICLLFPALALSVTPKP